jgi:hypothetical protein
LEVETDTVPGAPTPDFDEGSAGLGSKGLTVFAPAIPQTNIDTVVGLLQLKHDTLVVTTSLESDEDATAHHSPLSIGKTLPCFLSVKVKPVPVGVLRLGVESPIALAKTIMMSLGFEVVSDTEHIAELKVPVPVHVFDVAPSMLRLAA